VDVVVKVIGVMAQGLREIAHGNGRGALESANDWRQFPGTTNLALGVQRPKAAEKHGMV